jgi:hypothetical protein
MKYECGVCFEKTQESVKCRRKCSFDACQKCVERLNNKCPQCRGMYGIRKYVVRDVFTKDERIMICLWTYIIIGMYLLGTGFSTMLLWAQTSRFLLSCSILIPVYQIYFQEFMSGAVTKYMDGSQRMKSEICCNLISITSIGFNVVFLDVYPKQCEMALFFASVFLTLSSLLIICEVIDNIIIFRNE